MSHTDQHRTAQPEDSENSLLKQQTENASEPKILFRRDEQLYESSIQARKEAPTQQVLFSERQLKDETIDLASSTYEEDSLLKDQDAEAVDKKGRSNFESEVFSQPRQE